MFLLASLGHNQDFSRFSTTLKKMVNTLNPTTTTTINLNTYNTNITCSKKVDIGEEVLNMAQGSYKHKLTTYCFSTFYIRNKL